MILEKTFYLGEIALMTPNAFQVPVIREDIVQDPLLMSLAVTLLNV